MLATMIVTKIGNFVNGRIRWGLNKCPKCNHKFGKQERTCNLCKNLVEADSILWLNFRKELKAK